MANPSNTIQTISMITPDAAAILGNNLQLAKRVSRDWDADFGVLGAKIGQTINIRRPARYTVRTGSVVDIQAQTETYSPLTFTQPIGVDTSFTSQELTFSFDDISKRLVAPAIVRIANQVEALGHNLLLNVYNMIGTPGTALTGGPSGTSLDAVLSAVALIYQNDAPVADGQLSAFNGPAFNATLSSNSRTLFNPQKEIGDIYMKGLQGEFADAMHFLAQLVLPHTNGGTGGTVATVTTPPTNPVESQYPLTGNLAVTVSDSSNPAVGDIFTIADIYSVNPQTKTAYSTLQQFTFAGVVSGASSTTQVWSVSPALQSSGPFQNVSALPAPTAQITFAGAATVPTANSLIIHRDAFMLANKELELPGGVDHAAYEVDPETGVGIRYVRMFDVRTNQMIDRFDTMVAWATLYEQLACRIATT